jgi:ring-1,2-phenylacetyl-CoA epoxidase subunit PaaE
MSIHFHPLTIKEIKKETADCISVKFEVPESLKEIFHFHHGQNITIKASVDGKELRRSYSICSAPYENELRVAIKKKEQGWFSAWAHKNFKPGQALEVLPPTGRFYTEVQPGQKKKYIAFAAGSGITPTISIIKSVLHAEPQSSFTLVYGNRNSASIIFKEELEGLKNKYMDRFSLINILSREKTDTPLFSGRINVEKLGQLKKIIAWNTADEIFLCGPEEMIFNIRDYLEQNRIEKKKIHFELFTTPDQNRPGVIPHEIEQEISATSCLVTVKLDGRNFDFELDFNKESILDAALAHGLDLPFSCKGGVCGSCRALLLEGKVDMDANYALEPEEVAAGFILTCQSHPRTGRISVDYDLR